MKVTRFDFWEVAASLLLVAVAAWVLTRGFSVILGR